MATSLEKLEKTIQRSEGLNVVLNEKDILKKKDFEDKLKGILDVLLKNQQTFREALANLQVKYQGLVEAVKNDNESALKDLKRQVNTLFVEGRLNDMSKEQKRAFNSLKSDIDKLLNGKVKEVDTRLAKVKDGKTPIKGVDFFDGKNPSHKELSILMESLVSPKLEDMDKRMKRALASRPMGRARIEFTDFIDVSTQCNGQTKTFILPRKDVRGIKTVIGTQFPRIFNSSGDWTLTGNIVTLGNSVAAPKKGQTLIVIAEVLFAS